MFKFFAVLLFVSLALSLVFGIGHYVALRGFYRVSKANNLRMGGRFYLSFGDLKWDHGFFFRLPRDPNAVRLADSRQRGYLLRLRRWGIASWSSVIVFGLSLFSLFSLALVTKQ